MPAPNDVASTRDLVSRAQAALAACRVVEVEAQALVLSAPEHEGYAAGLADARRWVRRAETALADAERAAQAAEQSALMAERAQHWALLDRTQATIKDLLARGPMATKIKIAQTTKIRPPIVNEAMDVLIMRGEVIRVQGVGFMLPPAQPATQST